ncbi:CotH kinase family protein [Aquimarina sp. MMG016]|uniref:CotH kinase family protein n=1 Tax=Aquimarina sp. MMG016 TaxID=2822690 RepID=UPI001B3A1537|nr:CotH kinase family protein [Aquimarina sp. MMG016]MBQ4820572.1 CotH kinase family protein [Aquimarina sp. MMG016]
MKFKKEVLFLYGLTLCCCTQLLSQDIEMLTPKKERYGIDQTHKIIVWNFRILDTWNSNSNMLNINFEGGYVFSSSLDSLSYAKSYSVNHGNDIFKLYITQLPITKITIEEVVKDDPKVSSQFTFTNKDSSKNALAGIELRGNISLKFPKKSYDLEFWEDAKEEISIDKQFGNLREDDDWILDGLYNEPLRLRSYFCNKLWLSIHKPSYLNQEEDAKSGIDLMFTEVFLDSKYIGIYALTEQVDRKLLQLKKHKKRKVRGELFKAGSHNGAPAYKMAPKYKNIFPHWAGYEIEYPFLNYKAQWKNIYRFTKFVIKSKDSTFKKKIAQKFDLDNAIDYFLFINLIRATDNLGKNFYVARYDKKTPYFNVPWDLDGVLGTIQDGKRIPTTDDILSNGLFDRLLKVNPDNYRQRLKNRWLSLREGAFSDQNLFNTLREIYKHFNQNKVYEREMMIWPSDVSMSEHLEYIESWLSKRLIFLDDHFENL